MRGRSKRRTVLVAAVLMTGPRVALASDGNLPRTPMLHQGTACLTVVDRQRQPVVRLDYTIPFSDTCVGPLEPEGSRTHRYVALCRSPEPWEALPHWLHPDDVASSLAAGALLEQEQPSAADVLSSSSMWGDCHALVGSPDERNPIHCVHAREGVQWDTRTLPAGVWILAGYTYHPPMNMWSRRTGVFKIVDGADDPPAVGMHPLPAHAGDEPPLELRACVDARPGSTLHVAAAATRDADPSWTEIATVSAESGKGELVLPLDLGSAFAAPATLALRVEVREPGGRSFAYVAPEPIVYVGGPTPEAPPTPDHDYCEEPIALQPQVCPPGTGPGAGEDPDPEASCAGCNSGSPSLHPLAWGVLLVAARRSRRGSRARAHRPRP